MEPKPNLEEASEALPRLEFDMGSGLCACMEKGCSVPLLSQTMLYLNVEELRPPGSHCDCIILVRCPEGSVVALLIELKSTAKLLAQSLAYEILLSLGQFDCIGRTRSEIENEIEKLTEGIGSKFAICSKIAADTAALMSKLSGRPLSNTVVVYVATAPSNQMLVDALVKHLKEKCGVILPSYARQNIFEKANKLRRSLRGRITKELHMCTKSQGSRMASHLLDCDANVSGLVELIGEACRQS